MKCIRCDTDNTLKDRTENRGRCKNCQHPFAFEPKNMGTITFTDPFFLKVITELSDDNTLFFTPKQLFYVLEKRLKNKTLFVIVFVWIIFVTMIILGQHLLGILILPLAALIASILLLASSSDSQANLKARRARTKASIFFGVITLAGAILILLLYSDIIGFLSFTIFVILGMTVIYLGIRKLPRLPSISQAFTLTSAQFQEWGNAWVRVNGSIEKMLPAPRVENQPTNLNSEITAYSFDRAVICDSAEIAQFLIANNFHFENNCAVLSITGYPQSIFSTVMEMLHRNPELKVYAIHNASPRGVCLVHQLRTDSNWFANHSATIYDLGLLPRQVLKSRNLFIRNLPDSAQQATRLPAAVKQELSQDELQWLEKGDFVELESFTPRRLLQILTRGISLSQAPDVEDALVPIESAGGMIFMSESFG